MFLHRFSRIRVTKIVFSDGELFAWDHLPGCWWAKWLLYLVLSRKRASCWSHFICFRHLPVSKVYGPRSGNVKGKNQVPKMKPKPWYRYIDDTTRYCAWISFNQRCSRNRLSIDFFSAMFFHDNFMQHSRKSWNANLNWPIVIAPFSHHGGHRQGLPSCDPKIPSTDGKSEMMTLLFFGSGFCACHVQDNGWFNDVPMKIYKPSNYIIAIGFRLIRHPNTVGYLRRLDCAHHAGSMVGSLGSQRCPFSKVATGLGYTPNHPLMLVH